MPGITLPLPLIGGADIAGVVVNRGRDVEGIEVGTRVVLDPHVAGPLGKVLTLGEHVSGGLAEYVTAPAANAIPIPPHISFEQAAALPIAYGTAWRMLTARGRVQAGERILVLGAGGGVGTACIQIGRMFGCTVLAASTDRRKLERLRVLGATHTLDYREEPDFHRTVRRLTEGEGVDVVVDTVGQATWARSLKSLRRGGRLLTCGATSGYDAQTDLRFVWSKELSIIGADGWDRSDILAVLAAVEKGRITPVIDRVLPLAQVREAHRLLEERLVFGKLVIVPSGASSPPS